MVVSDRLIALSGTSLALFALTLGVGASPQTPEPPQRLIDFATDVRPLLDARCSECHGPTEAKNGYRLDRRSVALAGINRPNIVPRSAESSRLYRRIIGGQFGTQMPPDEPLTSDEVGILKRWIDEGAEWPDVLANEANLPPQDPVATQLIEAIRLSDRRSVLAQVSRTPSVLNARGPNGSTPLMHAALYGDASLVSAMLRAGADPNIRNDVGATALLWALDDMATVRVLLDAGARIDDVSNFGRSSLGLAALAGSSDLVALLLKRGATATPAALLSAASRGDASIVRMLVASGARDRGGAAASAARRSGCLECADVIVGSGAPPPMRNALTDLVAPGGAGIHDVIRYAIERGADVNARDAKGRTVAMLAASSEALSPESMSLLIARGADVNVRDGHGVTVLDAAKRSGHTAVVDALVAAGASPGRPLAGPPLSYVRNNGIGDAVARSLPLLQRSGVSFYEKSGCVSCHHNSLTAMTVSAARQGGFAVNEDLARRELATVVKDVTRTTDQAVQQMVTPGGLATTTGYILMGLSAERHSSGTATDVMVRLLRRSQSPDGGWRTTNRPPSESSRFTATAVSLRGMQLYGQPPTKAADVAAVRRATTWLRRAVPQNTEDRVFRLLGLTWSRASASDRQSALRDLAATQRADGGWAQLPALSSDAYATGSALVALHEAGMPADADAYKRGVRYLLTTQLEDGSWFVTTRSQQTQIYFDSGFPHGVHQFISAAATNWATLALIHGLPAPGATQATGAP